MMTSDKTLKMLMDPNVRFIDLNTENFIVSEIIGDFHKWPGMFKSVGWSPSESLMHSMALMAFTAPGKTWGIECIEPDIEYEVWIEDTKYAARAWNPARAMFAAVWNRHIMQESEKKHDDSIS